MEESRLHFDSRALMRKSIRPYLNWKHGTWIAVCLILLLALPAAADIYMYIDSEATPWHQGWITSYP